MHFKLRYRIFLYRYNDLKVPDTSIWIPKNLIVSLYNFRKSNCLANFLVFDAIIDSALS